MTILAMMEAAAGEAARFRVRVIKAGLSLNSNVYPPDVLREAVPLFAGARVIAKTDADHLAGGGRDVRGVLGRLVDPVFVESDGGAIEAIFEAIDPDEPLIKRLRLAVERGMTDLFGLSITAKAAIRESVQGGQRVRTATRFLAVKSVDLIVEPGAGGRVLDVVEAAPEDMSMLRDTIIAKIKACKPELLAGRDAAALADEDLAGLFVEAVAGTPPHAGQTIREAAPDVAAITAAAVDVAMARVGATSRVRASALPEAGKTRVLAQLRATGTFTEAAADAAIAAELDYISTLSPAGRVTGLGGQVARVTTGETRGEKVRSMLEAFFDPGHKDHRAASSFRECYVEITGDRDITGRLRDCNEGWMREALQSDTLGNVLGDAITRRMLADYRLASELDIWRQIVTVTRVNDFRTQQRLTMGGYGDLPVVAEADPYLAVTSPDDDVAEYAVIKRGGLESITLEAITNDDVGVIRRVPVNLSRAAKRTLSKFVLDFIRTNPTIYDGAALFHASHGNLGSTALSSTSFAAARLAMKEQTQAGSGEKIGVGPRFLIVPDALEETARNLFVRGTNNDPTFIQSLNPVILPVWYWTDATDWAIAAAPENIPSIEVGFLAGREEPELWVQDSPTEGSMFSNDKLTWKIRHIYGGAVTDYRGLYKAVVA